MNFPGIGALGILLWYLTRGRHNPRLYVVTYNDAKHVWLVDVEKELTLPRRDDTMLRLSDNTALALTIGQTVWISTRKKTRYPAFGWAICAVIFVALMWLLLFSWLPILNVIAGFVGVILITLFLLAAFNPVRTTAQYIHPSRRLTAQEEKHVGWVQEIHALKPFSGNWDEVLFLRHAMHVVNSSR